MDPVRIRQVLPHLLAQPSFQITFSHLIYYEVSGGEFRINQAGYATDSQNQDGIATTYNSYSPPGKMLTEHLPDFALQCDVPDLPKTQYQRIYRSSRSREVR